MAAPWETPTTTVPKKKAPSARPTAAAPSTTVPAPRIQPTIPNPTGNFGVKVVNNNIKANNRRILAAQKTPTTTTSMPKAPTTVKPVVASKPAVTTTSTTVPPRAMAVVPPTVPKVTPAQKAALVKTALDRKQAQNAAATAATRAKALATVRTSGGGVVPGRVNAAGAPVTSVMGGALPPAGSLAGETGRVPVAGQPVTAVQGTPLTQLPGPTAQAGDPGIFDTGISGEYNTLFDVGQQREAQRKAKIAALIDEIRKAASDNLGDLSVPTDETQWTGDYNTAIGNLVDSRDQLSGDVNDLFQQQIGAIQNDQNRYLSNLNSNASYANGQIGSIASGLQSRMAPGAAASTAAQQALANNYSQNAAQNVSTANDQSINANPLVQQQQAAVAVQNAYKSTGYTPQELAALANQYAGQVARNVASSKADAGYRYVDAYNEAFNNQKKSITDIFSQFNTGLAQLLTGKTNAQAKFNAANQNGVNVRGDLLNKTYGTILDAVDKMERQDPYLADAMNAVAANVRNQQTILGAAQRNDATIAGANSRTAATIAAANDRAAARLAAKGGGSGGSGGIATKPTFLSGKKYIANLQDMGAIGPNASRWAQQVFDDASAAVKKSKGAVTFDQAAASSIKHRTGTTFDAGSAKIIKKIVGNASRQNATRVRKK